MENIDKIRELLHKIAHKQDYQNHKLTVTPISSDGASFTTFLYTATITSPGKDDLNLFVKFAAMGASIREQVTLNIYKVEQFVYTELREIFRSFEEKYQVPEKHRFIFTKYYGAITTVLEETLVLEDLVAGGFKSHDRFKSIDWQYGSTAVTELAKFHALTMAFRRDFPDKFQQYKEVYEDDWINEYSVGAMWKPSFDTAVKTVPEKDKAKVKKFFDSIGVEEMKNLYKPLRCEVITHVDFKPSNLMHRINEDGSTEIRVIDFQTLKASCPVLDLLFFIFAGTDKAFRDKYYQKLVDHYYTQLSDAMARLKFEPTTYTREDFDYELKEKLPFGLIIAAYTLLIVTQDSSELPAVGDEDLGNFAMSKGSSLYQERLTGVIEDYKKWGVLTD